MWSRCYWQPEASMENSRSCSVKCSLLLFASCGVLIVVNGFNMDLKAPIVQSIPSTSSYFGFSVAMHKENSVNTLLVGAPRHQTADSEVDRGGALFQCPITPFANPSACQELNEFDSQGTEFDEQGARIATKSGQWFGASVRSSGEKVLACRPLYTWFITPEGSTKSEREPIGGCFLARNNFSDIEIYEPCRTTVVGEQTVFGITHCQAGFDADMRNDKILLGAPGSFFWQGQIWVTDSDLRNEQRTNEGPLAFDDSYRGYAVAIGNFMGGSTPEYAVGIPRARNAMGLVSIFDSTLTAYLNITGLQVGAYFGQSLAISDLNGDGLDDIVIGAPLFIDEAKTTNGWEVGKVYIYYNDGNSGFSGATTILGTQAQSRFGSTIAALSDVNQDGYNDLAISAPYGGTTGSGVVYIYHGQGSRGLSLTAAQTLEPSSFGLDISTFGYSLSAGLDMDDNLYPDLLVGAYKSNTAVLVRSRPVVHVTTSLTAVTPSIDLQNTDFTLRDGLQVSSFNLSVCIVYTGTNVPSSLNFTHSLVLDHNRPTLRRALFVLSGSDSNSQSTVSTLQSNVEECNLLTAYIQPTIVDKLSPIGVSLSFGLANETPPPGSILPILDETSITHTTVSVPITRNCMNQTCVPDLNVQASSDTEALLVGASESVTIDVRISNTAEDAYISKLAVSVPEELQYVGFSSIESVQIVTCTTSAQKSDVSCDVGNPFQAGSTVVLQMQFSSENLPGNRDKATFNFRVSSVDREVSPSDNELNVTIAIRVAAQLSLFGVSNPEKLIYAESDYLLTRNIQYEREIGPEVTHVFSLYNNGPSSVGRTVVTIPWPMRYDGRKEHYLLYLISATMDTGEECTINGELNPENIKTNNGSTPLVSSSRRRRATSTNGTVRGAWTTPSPSASPSPLLQKDLACDGEQRKYCYTIECTVDSLGAGVNAARDNVVITVRSRVWTNTLTENSLEMAVFVTAEANVISVSYVTSLTEPINVSSNEVKTSIIPHFLIREEQQKKIPLWVYLVSALSGVIILLVLIVVLYVAGFFKRMKITPEQREKLFVKESREAEGMENTAVPNE